MGKDDITLITASLGARQAAEGAPCLVVFYGENIGSRHIISDEFVIGRSEGCDLQVDEESVSRRHASIRVQNDQTSVLTDLGSTNGTYVNDTSVQTCELRDGDLLGVGQTILKYLSGDNLESKYHEEIYRLTTIDGLTSAYNKRYFLESLDREINRSSRYGRVLSLVMADIDHFKTINDNHGHLAGDFILRNLAGIIAKNLRREDLFARYGGEEFAIVLPEIDAEGARRVCEKLRSLVAENVFEFDGEQLHVTISLGINTLYSEEGEVPPTVDSLIAGADTQLYAAKQAGRNRVCL